MSEHGSGKIVRLKNGAQIEADRGWECLDCLRVLLEDEPRHFQTLLALARGDSDKVDSKSVSFLLREGLLRRDGSLDPALCNVLLSGYRETEEGPVVANPFQPADAHEARALEAQERAEREAFKRKNVVTHPRRGRQGTLAVAALTRPVRRSPTEHYNRPGLRVTAAAPRSTTARRSSCCNLAACSRPHRCLPPCASRPRGAAARPGEPPPLALCAEPPARSVVRGCPLTRLLAGRRRCASSADVSAPRFGSSRSARLRASVRSQAPHLSGISLSSRRYFHVFRKTSCVKSSARCWHRPRYFR